MHRFCGRFFLQARLLVVHVNPLQRTDLEANLQVLWYEMKQMRCIVLGRQLIVKIFSLAWLFQRSSEHTEKVTWRGGDD